MATHSKIIKCLATSLSLNSGTKQKRRFMSNLSQQSADSEECCTSSFFIVICPLVSSSNPQISKSLLSSFSSRSYRHIFRSKPFNQSNSDALSFDDEIDFGGKIPTGVKTDHSSDLNSGFHNCL